MDQDEFLPAHNINKCYAVVEKLSIDNTFSGLPSIFMVKSIGLWVYLRTLLLSFAPYFPAKIVPIKKPPLLKVI